MPSRPGCAKALGTFSPYPVCPLLSSEGQERWQRCATVQRSVAGRRAAVAQQRRGHRWPRGEEGHQEGGSGGPHTIASSITEEHFSGSTWPAKAHPSSSAAHRISLFFGHSFSSIGMSHSPPESCTAPRHLSAIHESTRQSLSSTVSPWKMKTSSPRPSTG